MQIQIDIIPEGGARAARGIFFSYYAARKNEFFKGLCAECIFLDRRSTQVTFWDVNFKQKRDSRSA